MRWGNSQTGLLKSSYDKTALPVYYGLQKGEVINSIMVVYCEIITYSLVRYSDTVEYSTVQYSTVQY